MDQVQIEPVHSDLGGSGAERWSNCFGSAALIKRLNLGQEDDVDYRTEGTGAHHHAAQALSTGRDAWELIGDKAPNGVECTQDMSTHLQLYLDHVRELASEPGAQLVVEHPITSDKHPKYFGTMDARVITGTTLHMRDLKYGEGIQVDAEWNEQLMYYTYPELVKFPEIERVTLGIVQPRGFHPLGPVRVWETDRATVVKFVEDELIPAMYRTEWDNTLDAGPWCRFCPAKLICPMLTGLFRAACNADKSELKDLSDVQLGLQYQQSQAVKFYLKALEEEAFKRLMAGKTLDQDGTGAILVLKQAHRVWKTDAEEKLLKKYKPEDIYTKPELKSPAEVEKLGPAAKELVSGLAYKPQTGYTVALASSGKMAIKVKPASEQFAGALTKINNGG